MPVNVGRQQAAYCPRACSLKVFARKAQDEGTARPGRCNLLQHLVVDSDLDQLPGIDYDLVVHPQQLLTSAGCLRLKEETICEI